jgi:hypothetical protein
MAVFSDAFLRLRQDLDQGHESRQKLIRDVGEKVREMARQTGSQLAEQGARRRAEFPAMINDLRGRIEEQAEQTRSQLADLAADLRHGGEIFAGRQPARRHPSRKS